MRWRTAMIAALLWPGAVRAADDPSGRIVVGGIGIVSTPPDVATIGFHIVGEGATSDAAVAAMVARQRAIAGATGGSKPMASEVSVVEVRGPDCRRDDDGAARLSTGKCAVVGYVARTALTLRTTAIAGAGTLVELLARLGALGPRIEGFALAEPAAAQRRAVAAALTDARTRAEAIAAGTGVHLGRLLVASTEPRGEVAPDIVVTGSRISPPAITSPPIVVDLTPAPVETRAEVIVTYAIER